MNNLGIAQQVRSFMGVDSTQYPTYKIVNSVNNYLDTVAGYAIGADKNFQWDDTNHSMLPEGTTPVVASQTDYSFLTDEQGNRILTLIRIDLLGSGGVWQRLSPLDETEEADALSNVVVSGIPTGYYKIADNIIRLNRIPASGTLKFSFQRTPSYFTASDTTKEPGVASLLHRGFVISAAYDGAITLGLPNTNTLGAERVVEMQKMEKYFSDRNKDMRGSMRPARQNNR